MRERFGAHDLVDAGRVIRSSKLSNFPVLEDDKHCETGTVASLLRVADLIGRLGDPHYPRKLNVLFYELAEISPDVQLGYVSPAYLAKRRRAFFWGKIAPVIGDAIRALDLTVKKRSWVAGLRAFAAMCSPSSMTAAAWGRTLPEPQT